MKIKKMKKVIFAILPTLAFLLVAAMSWYVVGPNTLASLMYELLPSDGIDPSDGIADVTSRQLGSCPFGHDQLKDVPVVYGLLDWTPALHRKADDLEFWPGGCVLGHENSKVVCDECRYAYDSSFKYWEKHAETASEFERPLSKLIAAFPIPPTDQVKSKIVYYQRIKDKAFYSDSLFYWSSEETEQIEARILQYLRQKQLNPSVTKSSFQDRRTHTIKCKSNDKWVFVDIRYHEDMKQTAVHVDLSAKQAESIKNPSAFVTED